MKIKLNHIYCFLEENRQFNHVVQHGFYNSCISPHQTPSQKVKSLLFSILNTQSQPKLDKMMIFWKNLNGKDISSFKSFSKAIGTNSNNGDPFDSLFKALKKQPAWGDKTAALFIKAIFHVHRGYYKKYSFWKDVPPLSISDKLRLPVDSVIIHIFKKISHRKIKSFAGINALLWKNGYRGDKIEVWDDLWFWGFITQKGTGKDRKVCFNESKYWALLHSDKSDKTLFTIRKKADEFKYLIK